MTMLSRTRPATTAEGLAGAAQTPAQHHPHRWRLHRAGMVNVWYYYDAEFIFSGGRLVLRGTNGSGKSRALEMLLPFLLDADRRRMDATGSGRVRLEDLMRAGGEEQANRLGYLWLELVRYGDGTERTTDDAVQREFLTLGALVRFAKSTGEAKAWYFTTPRRVGQDLILLSEDRTPLSREGLAEVIGVDRVTESPETHRERVRAAVFGLTGDSGKERFAGLLQLLRTLRSPDVGNRIEEGKLPQILSDALPPPSEAALSQAGEQLDGLSETRSAQQRLETAYKVVSDFLDTYRRYAVGVLSGTAEAARAAAVSAEEAEQQANELCEKHQGLVDDHAQAQAQEAELTITEEELRRSVEGIRGSKAYRAVRELHDREVKVKALEEAAAWALRTASAARDDETGKVRGADERAEDITNVAQQAAAAGEKARDLLSQAGVRATLPRVASARGDEASDRTEVVRLSLDAEPELVARPVPVSLDVTPRDLTDAIEQVTRAAHAAKQRNVHASARLEQARLLDQQAGEVETADKRASEAEQRLTDATREAEGEEEALDRASITLARDWAAWIAHETTQSLLGDVDWHSTALRPVLDDAGALLRGDMVDVLPELDHVASQAATAVHHRLSAAMAGLTTEQKADDARRGELETERDELLAAHDPAPPLPHWTQPPTGDEVPLWRAIDFGPHLDERQRAGLEAALLASGLLTATIDANGGLTASDGRLLVRPAGPVAARSLNEALVIEAESPMPPKLVRDVLARIAWDDQSHPTWVNTDGAWGNGPLTGRHRVPAARHIGAAARAAARAARLAEIDRLLATLAEAAEIRTVRRKALLDDRRAVDAHIRSAPRSQPVQTAHVVHMRAVKRVESAEATFRKARGEASELRRTWTEALSTHREACAGFGLPITVNELDTVRDQLREAGRACESTHGRLTELQRRISLHEKALIETRTARERRNDAEVAAERQWATWHGEASELAALKANVGAAAERVRAELSAAESALETCSRELTDTRGRVATLAERKGTTEAEARTARERAAHELRSLTRAVNRLAHRLALPGVAAAATGQPHVRVPLAHVDPTSVGAAVDGLLALLDRRGAVTDENVLIRAQQTAERELSGGLDVIPTVDDGVRLVAIVDGTGQRSLPEAAAELRRQCEEGRHALSERERRVFTEFVLGGVAEELRQRLFQAEALIKAMNTSLSGISTSHGIGVRLRWNLTDHVGPAVARIRALVSTAGDVRSPEQTNELTDLLNARVNEAFAADPAAGYATHLKSALDYRAWHEVEVIITGPEPERERKISRRAKLSQGETRFVSYVTLFAAADAYLSGLPDTARALRLILLDDAFAKVDDPTIGELMGLLVRLDLDFAMTGHALWGFYPQVPALDCYEIRRGEGTAAVTTHVHWDGRNRHLRAAR
ncbi:TIGR02680 family protein [Nonomuraea roseoviolacea subsp. roseoviolacea]|uniref:TIGR02680 family protein n=1 Tax=Nonomuraea roseoviolacea TaxID=103837 RepID=UPI0031D97B61